MSVLSKYEVGSPVKYSPKSRRGRSLNQRLAERFRKVADNLLLARMTLGATKIIAGRIRCTPRLTAPYGQPLYGYDDDGNARCIDFGTTDQAAEFFMDHAAAIEAGEEDLLELIRKARSNKKVSGSPEIRNKVVQLYR